MLLMSSFLMFISSCKKNDLGTAGSGNVIRERPVGEPVADAQYHWIGPEGGTIISEDNRVKISIPAGALSEETEIGIQAIKNTAVSGIGHAYRFTPHGRVFHKKVTITFSYKNEARILSNDEALEIAFQDEKGKWLCKGNTINNKIEKTISVETDHFSDWSFIASMELSPVVKTVGLGEKVSLKALRYVHPVKDDDFLVPLSIPNVGSGESMLIESKYIVKWTLDGPGQLQANGSQATYTAPSASNANKIAIVTLELNVKGKQVLLISTIHLIEDGIQISIEGGPWQTYSGIATRLPELNSFTLANLRLTEDLPQIVLMWPSIPGKKADGRYAWSMFGDESSQVVFEYAEPALDKMYTSIYEDENNDFHDSPGFLSVEELEQNGKKYLSGMFAIDRSGLYNSATGEQESIKSIIGTFRVQRNW